MFITAVVVIPMNMIADSHYSICIRAADESLVSVHRQTRCTGARYRCRAHRINKVCFPIKHPADGGCRGRTSDSA